MSVRYYWLVARTFFRLGGKMALYQIKEDSLDRIEALLAAKDAGAALMVIARDLREANPARRRELLQLQARAYVDLACLSMELAFGEAPPEVAEQARKLMSSSLGLFRGDGLTESTSLVPEIPAGVRAPNELERMKLEQIFQALEEAGYVQCSAAEALKISKFQMHRELRKFGLIEAVRERRAQRSD